MICHVYASFKTREILKHVNQYKLTKVSTKTATTYPRIHFHVIVLYHWGWVILCHYGSAYTRSHSGEHFPFGRAKELKQFLRGVSGLWGSGSNFRIPVHYIYMCRCALKNEEYIYRIRTTYQNFHKGLSGSDLFRFRFEECSSLSTSSSSLFTFSTATEVIAKK